MLVWLVVGLAASISLVHAQNAQATASSSDAAESVSGISAVPSTASPTPTTSSPALNTQTGVYFNSTRASLYSSTTLYNPAAAPTPNYFDSIPPGYTSEEIAAPLNRIRSRGSPRWEAAYASARSYLASWSLDEKVQLTTGAGWQVGRCLGNIPAIPSQNFPGLCLQDSPLGVRLTDYVSAFPAGINVASTFDKDLMYARGYAMGREFRGKGAGIVLGPATNMGRVAAGGRNWESFGGDPYLSGWATEMTVKGLQDAGVQAVVKHYVGNEQERRREESSSNIDDRTMREIYSHPFLRGVAADAVSVMASYNLINGSWAAQNAKTLNGILKTDFGFEGYVMSDWQGTHSGVLAANNGLDMTMPGDIVFNSGDSYFGYNLTVAVRNGSVSADRLEDMAERILAAWFFVGQDKDFPPVNFDSFRRLSELNNSHVDVREDHDVLIRRIGSASTVLLKNINQTLPLRSPRSIFLAGSDMGPSPKGPNGFEDRGGLKGTLAMGWGSGTAEFPYLVDPLTAISHQARKDRSLLDWYFDDWDISGLQQRARLSRPDVAIVGIHSDSGEYFITYDGNVGDRNNLSAWDNGDNVVLAVANVTRNVVVVVHSVGPIDMEKWIDHPNVTAVLWAGLPGQESGKGLVDVLYGAYNPSGRLPYTIAKNRSDYPAEVDYVPTSGAPYQPQVNYTEGLFIDYRHFQAKCITPRYPFGFGLSYSSFNYTNLIIRPIQSDAGGHLPSSSGSTTATASTCATTQAISSTTSAPASPASSGHLGASGIGNGTKVGSFLDAYLQFPFYLISIDVQNVGGVYGCDVPQLYLSFPASEGEPPRVLREFSRVTLAPWDAKRVEWTLSRYDLSVWDVVLQKWRIPRGEIGVVVGRHSADEGMKGSITIAEMP